ncbi:MAG: hypothetical protein ABI678_14860 [Kofleriaceae bacterium]
MGVQFSRSFASSALAIGLFAAPLQARAETAMAAPGPNCANLIAQASGAIAGAIAQTGRLYAVCDDKGWTSSQCIAQGIVAAQSALWAWWTVSTAYCQCTPNPPQAYCQALGILEPPAAGPPALPPPGPPPPPPMKPVCGPANPVLHQQEL